MEIKGRDADRFVEAPPAAIRLVLLNGGDAALIRDRATALARAICPDLSDPFRITRIEDAYTRDALARIDDECRAISMFGGRRVVWLDGFRDSGTDTLAGLLGDSSWDALIVVEAPSLTKAAKAVKLASGAPDAALITCWEANAQEFEGYLRSLLREAGLTGEPAVIDHLVGVLPRDRAMARGEVEKLALYAGAGGRLTQDDVAVMVGGGTDADLGALCDAVFCGQTPQADRMLERAWADGIAPVVVLRATGEHLIRLREAGGRVTGGRDPEEVVKSLRIHFSRAGAFRTALRLWSPDRLAQAAGRLADAEAEAKTSHLPSQAVTARALIGIAAAASRGGR